MDREELFPRFLFLLRDHIVTPLADPDEELSPYTMFKELGMDAAAVEVFRQDLAKTYAVSIPADKKYPGLLELFGALCDALGI
ncbi:MAG: hypothetical protein IKV55_06420 [Oscillospiraceae bacterium]|nr:hypothetical protein [Oscillospiraceae bacterium]